MRRGRGIKKEEIMALNKVFFNQKVLIASYFMTKRMLWVLIRGTSALLMSTHNVCFR